MTSATAATGSGSTNYLALATTDPLGSFRVTLLDLPDELLLHVLLHVPLRIVLPHVALVCRRMHHLVRDDRLWRTACQRQGVVLKDATQGGGGCLDAHSRATCVGLNCSGRATSGGVIGGTGGGGGSGILVESAAGGVDDHGAGSRDELTDPDMTWQELYMCFHDVALTEPWQFDSRACLQQTARDVRALVDTDRQSHLQGGCGPLVVHIGLTLRFAERVFFTEDEGSVAGHGGRDPVQRWQQSHTGIQPYSATQYSDVTATARFRTGGQTSVVHRALRNASVVAVRPT